MKKRNKIVSKFRYRGRTIFGCVFHYNHSISYRGMYNVCYTDGVEGLDDVYPLGVLHPWNETRPGTSVVPVGSVRFHSKPDGLYFRAIVSKTTAGDEQMTLIKDGAMRSVSVGIFNLEYEQDQETGNVIVTRSKPYELSLCPTGMGAFPEARIH